MKGLIEGRIVHYVLPIRTGGTLPMCMGGGVIRPAIVVQVWDREPEGGDGRANLYVFPDGSNDGAEFEGPGRVLWATSVIYSERHEPGTWHWPPRGA